MRGGWLLDLVQVLCRWPQPLCFHGCQDPAMGRGHSFLLPPHPLAVQSLFLVSRVGSRALGMGCDINVPPVADPSTVTYFVLPNAFNESFSISGPLSPPFFFPPLFLYDCSHRLSQSELCVAVTRGIWDFTGLNCPPADVPSGATLLSHVGTFIPRGLTCHGNLQGGASGLTTPNNVLHDLPCSLIFTLENLQIPSPEKIGMLSKPRAFEDTGDTLFPRADTDLDICLVLIGSGGCRGLRLKWRPLSFHTFKIVKEGSGWTVGSQRLWCSRMAIEWD